MGAIKLSDCAKQLRDLLAPHGFSLKSSTWRRDVGEFMDVVEFRRGRFTADFTVNIGVLTKSVYETAWGDPAPALAKQFECTVHAPQLSWFFERGRWWDLADPAAMPQIADHVQNLVLPFMDGMHARAEQILYLRERQKSKFFREWLMPIYEAILMHECGEQAAACALLSKQEWPQRLPQILSQLNCPKL